MAKRMTDAQVVHFLEGEHPGLLFKIRDLNVGEHLEIEGFTISSEPGGITKIVRPDWCVKLESPAVN